MYKDVYLSLGSNLDDRAANLNIAITGLAALGRVEAVSSFYETEPVGFAAQPWFLNCAVKLSTEKMPDILLFGNSIIDTKELVVPHPAMHQRRFVLEPLIEIAPEVRHPVFKRTVRELRDALPPGQPVRRIENSSPRINANERERKPHT